MKLKDLVIAAGMTGLAACSSPAENPKVEISPDRTGYVECVDYSAEEFEEEFLKGRPDTANHVEERRIRRGFPPSMTECYDFTDIDSRREDMKSSYRLDKHVRPHPYGVLRQTRMPAALLELGNIADEETARTLSDTSEMKRLAEEVARGILYYKNNHNEGLENIILDDGHGDASIDPGSHVRHKGRIVRESDIVKPFQKYLAEELEELGFTTPLMRDYNRDEQHPWKRLPEARIDQYADSANSLGDSSNSVYISLHADKRPLDNYGFMAYHWGPFWDESKDLGESIFSAVSTEFWEEKFPLWAMNNGVEPRRGSSSNAR